MDNRILKSINENFNKIKGTEKEEKYLEIIQDTSFKLLGEIEQNKKSVWLTETLQDHLEDLLENEFFDMDLKEIIKKMTVSYFDYENNDDNLYIEVTVMCENIAIKTIVSHMINGNRVDHEENLPEFTITCEDVEIKSCNFCETLEKNKINEVFEKLISKKILNKIYEKTETCFSSKNTLKNIIKILLTMPYVWYKCIY